MHAIFIYMYVPAMMTRPEIEQKVNAILTDDLEIAAERLAPDARLRDDLGVDSLDVVDIVVLVNDTFGFKMTTAEVRGLETLGQFYDYVEQRLA